jgi:hypothetical protein
MGKREKTAHNSDFASVVPVRAVVSPRQVAIMFSIILGQHAHQPKKIRKQKSRSVNSENNCTFEG